MQPRVKVSFRDEAIRAAWNISRSINGAIRANPCFERGGSMRQVTVYCREEGLQLGTGEAPVAIAVKQADQGRSPSELRAIKQREKACCELGRADDAVAVNVERIKKRRPQRESSNLLPSADALPQDTKRGGGWISHREGRAQASTRTCWEMSSR